MTCSASVHHQPARTLLSLLTMPVSTTSTKYLRSYWQPANSIGNPILDKTDTDLVSLQAAYGNMQAQCSNHARDSRSLPACPSCSTDRAGTDINDWLGFTPLPQVPSILPAPDFSVPIVPLGKSHIHIRAAQPVILLPHPPQPADIIQQHRQATQTGSRAPNISLPWYPNLPHARSLCSSQLCPTN